MSSTFRPLGPSELLPRYIFAEGLFAGRRVLEVGAVASTGGRSAQLLAARGARSVLACDADLGAVESAQKSFGGANLHFRADVFDDLETGSFDFALIADLGDFVRSPQRVRELRRLLSDSGYLMGGLRNPAGLALSQLVEPESSDPPATYGQLVDVLSPHFQHIEVATQSPILGYQVAFDRGAGLQVDGTLASAGEAAYFIVVAGQEPCQNVEPTWVQLPAEPLAYMGTRVDEYSRRSYELAERSTRLKQALEKARSDLSLREVELERAHLQLDRTREDSARVWAELQTLKSDGPHGAERDELAARVRRRESELQAASERATEAEARIAQQREQLEAAQNNKLELESRLAAVQESSRVERLRREELSKLVEDSATRLSNAREEVRAAHDDAAAARLELQQARAAHVKTQEEMDASRRDLDEARERELRLADQASALASEAEQLRGQLGQATAAAQAGQAQLSLARGETEAALRASAADSESLREARKRFGEDQQRAQEQAAAAIASRQTADAELATALAEVGRLSRELEAAAVWEKRSNALSGELETKLAEARDASGLDRLQRELEEEKARARRLENDVATAIGAERSTRERSEIALREAEENCAQLRADRDQLRSRLSELEAASDELRRALEQEASAAEARLDDSKEKIRQLSEEVGRAENRAAATARELDSLRVDAQLAADRAAEREHRVSELAARVRELEGGLDELRGQVATREQEKADLIQGLETAKSERTSIHDQLQARERELANEHALLRSQQEVEQAELTRECALLRRQLETKEADLVAAQQHLKSSSTSADAAMGRLRGELAAERARKEAAQQEFRDAQAAVAASAVQAEQLRSDIESAGAEVRILEDERLRLSTQVEHLEAERAWMAERLEAAVAERDALQHAAEGTQDREAELSTALADRESKLEILQRRLAAQDSELAALRRSLSRTPSSQVQQIYERATAELSAVKAGLARRTASPGPSAPDKSGSSSTPTSPLGPGRNPSGMPAPAGGASMKASEIEPKKE